MAGQAGRQVGVLPTAQHTHNTHILYTRTRLAGAVDGSGDAELSGEVELRGRYLTSMAGEGVQALARGRVPHLARARARVRGEG